MLCESGSRRMRQCWLEEIATACCYFDTLNKMRSVPDEGSTKFDNTDAAMQAAARLAAEIGTSELARDDPNDIVTNIEVRDELNQQFFTVTASTKAITLRLLSPEMQKTPSVVWGISSAETI